MNRVQHSRDAALLDHGSESFITPDRFVVQPQDAHRQAGSREQHDAARVGTPDDSGIHVRPILLGF
jgi:hypothetical protein